MRNRTICAVAAASTLWLFTACGGGGGADDQAAGGDSNQAEVGFTPVAGGQTFDTDGNYTFDVPEGWTALRTSGFTDDDFNFDVYKGDKVSGDIFLSLEPAEWSNADDVRDFLENGFDGIEGWVPVTVGNYAGYQLTEETAGDLRYELAVPDGNRLAVIYSTSLESSDVDAIVASVRVK